MAHFSTFVLVALDRERREREGRTGTDAACQQSIHARCLLTGTQGSKEASAATRRPDDFAGELRRCDSSDFSGGSTTRCGVVCVLIYGVEEWEKKAGTGIALKKQELRPLTERFGATENGLRIAKRLRNMVGTRRLELLTSTVSIRLS